MEEVSAAVSSVGSASNVALSESIVNLDKKFTDALATLSAHIEKTNTTLGMFAEQVDKVRGPPSRSISEADRAMNVVLVGITEDRDPIRWRKQVDDTLEHLAGRPIEIVDMTRAGGRYRDGYKRPVLIKLRSFWYKRILLSAKRKLKDYSSEPIYIHADEPIEVRRKQTMDRLKNKAEREGKRVSVNNGILTVGDMDVFSLLDGFLNRDNNKRSTN